jgi:hypothetical protein
MKGLQMKLGIVVAGVLLAASPALAQRPEPGAAAERGGGGSGPMANGGAGGGAASGGGGGVISSGGGSVSSSGGGFSSSSPSATMMGSPSRRAGAFRATAPEHRLNYSETGAQRQRPSSGARTAPPSSGASSNRGGDHAVTRGPASSNAGSGRRAGEPASTNNTSGASEVPTWSRPRGDRPATDSAVTRVGPRPGRGDDRGDNAGYYPYYDPYYYGGFGYGFGLYDQGFYGYPFYSPFGMGYGIPYGFYDPFYGDPYQYGAGYGAYSSRVYGGHDQGNLKLKVKPRQAKVYVDGYYVGLVDEFDGAFQKLTLNGGRHKVELRADGYETTEFDVLITPEQTVTFAGEMKKAQ